MALHYDPDYYSDLILIVTSKMSIRYTEPLYFNLCNVFIFYCNQMHTRDHLKSALIY